MAEPSRRLRPSVTEAGARQRAGAGSNRSRPTRTNARAHPAPDGMLLHAHPILPEQFDASMTSASSARTAMASGKRTPQVSNNEPQTTSRKIKSPARAGLKSLGRKAALKGRAHSYSRWGLAAIARGQQVWTIRDGCIWGDNIA